MAITRTAAFIAEQIKTSPGNTPVLLVEVLGADLYFASREPGFTGQWLSGDGLVSGTSQTAGASYPVYDTSLAQITEGGVGSISSEITTTGLSRTGSTTFSVLNQELFNRTLNENGLTNAVARVRLGFFGQSFEDYITVFLGSVDEFRANYNTVGFQLIDDTLINTQPFPPRYGADFFARSFQLDGAISFVLGHVPQVPAAQLYGVVTSNLAFSITAVSTSIELLGGNLPLPPTGTMVLNTSAPFETFSYTSVQDVVINNVVYTQLLGLDRPTPLAFAAGTQAQTLQTTGTFVYSFGLDSNEVSRIRESDGTFTPNAPDAIKTVPVDVDGFSDKSVLTVEYSADQGFIVADITGTASRNLILNGEAEADPNSVGWTVVNGTWSNILVGTENVFLGDVGGGQLQQSTMTQDITTTVGARYRLSASVSSSASQFASILIGTTVAPASIHNFGELFFAVETPVSVDFTATETTTRITLLVDNTTTPATATFDHIRVFDLASLNPATQVRGLINSELGLIKPDTTSFTEAETIYGAEGDLLNGVVFETQEAQGLLGRIAEQFRAKTFLDENGKQRWKVFNNAAAAIGVVSPDTVDKGSFNVTYEPLEAVFSSFFVYYNRNYNTSGFGVLGGREAYQNVVFATPVETNSATDAALTTLCMQARDRLKATQTHEVFADFIRDTETAERLLSHITRLGTHRRVLVDWTTYLDAVHFEVGDVVRVSHPLLPQFANNVTYEILAKELIPGQMHVRFTAAEIRQTAFNIFTEVWEPELFLLPSVIINEAWTPAGNFPPILADVDCNPYTETWQAQVSATQQILFNRLVGDNELSKNLIGSWSFTDSDYSLRRRNLAIANPPQAAASTGILVWGSPGGVVAGEPVLVTSGGPGVFGEAQFDRSIPGNTTFGLGGDSPVNRTSSLAWDRDVTISVWVNLSSKPVDSMGIWHIAGERTDGVNDAYLNYIAIWWDSTSDRFIAAHGNQDTLQLQGELYMASLTNRVVASSFGSPGTGVWLHLLVRYDASTTTLDITVNDGVTDSAVITPTFGFFENRSVGHNQVFNTGLTPAIGRYLLGTIDKTRTGDPSNRLGWNGSISLPHVWQTRLSDASVTLMYNGGAGRTAL